MSLRFLKLTIFSLIVLFSYYVLSVERTQDHNIKHENANTNKKLRLFLSTADNKIHGLVQREDQRSIVIEQPVVPHSNQPLQQCKD